MAGSGVAAPPAARRAQFEYLGGRVLTVVGPASGRQYRFVGYGARLSIDPRDRVALAHVPSLRHVRE